MVWHIEMLGKFEAKRGEEVLVRFRSQKAGMLLAYLALHSGKMQSRERLADLLWPDALPEVGRTNLRTALASLRRQLEPPGVTQGSILVIEGRSLVGLNQETVTTDVRHFEERLGASGRTGLSAGEQIARLTDATALYRGPLLPELYEEWALQERDALTREHLNALLRLASLQEQQGTLAEALETVYRALVADAFCEPAHASVIRLLRAMGQSAAATRHHTELKARWERELGEEPPAEITALLTASPIVSKEVKISAPDAKFPAPLVPEHEKKPVGEDTSPANHSAERDPAGKRRLPIVTTRYFGRETEIQNLAALLQTQDEAESERLITITGVGGVGKTRMMVETLRKVSETFSGSLLFVPLADVQDSERIPDTIASALQLQLNAENSAFEQVCAALAADNPPVVLALDNFEHLAETAALLPKRLVERVPNLICLITSRQRLNLEGEREFSLVPLPAPEHSGTPERLLEFSSVALFVSRAQNARPDFQITRQNAAAIAALCARLEGLPLAIELAAAWAQLLTPAKMLERLENRFELLAARRRDLPERHRTLWAAIAWSYQLLRPDLQRFFAEMAVFRGGFTLGAVEAISSEIDHKEAANNETGRTTDTLEKVAELCERSLLLPQETRAETAAEIRFTLLESLREFAADQIGEPLPLLQERHAEYYAGLAVQSQSHLNGQDMQEWLERLEPELPNLRAALDWYARCENAQAELQLVNALAAFWMVRGGYHEARETLTAVLHRPAAQPPSAARAEALHQLAVTLVSQGDFSRAQSYSQESLALSRALHRQEQIAVSLNLLGVIAIETGQYEAALTYYTDALALNRELGNRLREAGNLNNLGNLALYQGDARAAHDYYMDCLALRREAGNPSRIAMTLYNLGMAAYDQGDYEAGVAYCREALAMARALQEKRLLVGCLQGLGGLYAALDEQEAARSVVYESLLVNQELGDPTGIAGGIEVYAHLARNAGHFEQAIFLTSAMIRLREEIDSVLSLPDRKRQTDLLAALRERLDPATFERQWQRGQTATAEQVLQWVLTELQQSSAASIRDVESFSPSPTASIFR